MTDVGVEALVVCELGVLNLDIGLHRQTRIAIRGLKSVVVELSSNKLGPRRLGNYHEANIQIYAQTRIQFAASAHQAKAWKWLNHVHSSNQAAYHATASSHFHEFGWFLRL